MHRTCLNVDNCGALQTARLVLLLFGDDTELVLQRLSSNPDLQLRYLKEIMRGAEHSSKPPSGAAETSDTSPEASGGEPRPPQTRTAVVRLCEHVNRLIFGLNHHI